jgi:hypothetical protein
MGYLDELRSISEKGTGELPTKPTKPGSVSLVSASPGRFQKDYARLLKLWHGKLTALDHLTSPPHWSLGRWLDTVDASLWLYETFAAQLVREGWTAADLFGVLPAYPGEGGLADRMGTARNLKLLDGVAHWKALHGVHRQFPRGSGVDLAKGGLRLIWEMG